MLPCVKFCLLTSLKPDISVLFLEIIFLLQIKLSLPFDLKEDPDPRVKCPTSLCAHVFTCPHELSVQHSRVQKLLVVNTRWTQKPVHCLKHCSISGSFKPIDQPPTLSTVNGDSPRHWFTTALRFLVGFDTLTVHGCGWVEHLLNVKQEGGDWESGV